MGIGGGVGAGGEGGVVKEGCEESKSVTTELSFTSAFSHEPFQQKATLSLENDKGSSLTATARGYSYA